MKRKENAFAATRKRLEDFLGFRNKSVWWKLFRIRIRRMRKGDYLFIEMLNGTNELCVSLERGLDNPFLFVMEKGTQENPKYTTSTFISDIDNRWFIEQYPELEYHRFFRNNTFKAYHPLNEMVLEEIFDDIVTFITGKPYNIVVKPKRANNIHIVPLKAPRALEAAFPRTTHKAFQLFDESALSLTFEQPIDPYGEKNTFVLQFAYTLNSVEIRSFIEDWVLATTHWTADYDPSFWEALVPYLSLDKTGEMMYYTFNREDEMQDVVFMYNITPLKIEDRYPTQIIRRYRNLIIAEARFECDVKRGPDIERLAQVVHSKRK